jgi:hypothetical protein
MTVAYVDTAFLENAGVLLEDLLAGKPTPRPRPVAKKARLTTAGALLKDAAPSAESEVARLRSERDQLLSRRRFGFSGPDHLKQWREAHPTPPGETALDDAAVTERLKQESQLKGEALAKDLIVAETRLEVERTAKQEADACAQRRASLSDAEAKALSDAVADADREVSRHADRSEKFSDLHVGSTDSAVARRRDEIARDFGLASSRAADARAQAAFYGVNVSA